MCGVFFAERSCPPNPIFRLDPPAHRCGALAHIRILDGDLQRGREPVGIQLLDW
jgi:hypothetical protein